LEASIGWLTLAALCPVLLVAPGGFLAFTLFDNRLAYALRLALAVALSPLVIGLEILALTSAGLSFEAAAPFTLLNIGAAALMRPRRGAIASVAAPDLRAVAACAAALAIWLVAGWLIEPGLRVYAWHNMMQAAPLYEIAQLPDPIEEWDLAGFTVHYPWLGHIQIAVMAKLADISPFYVYPIANIVTLFPTVALLGACVLRLRPAAPIAAPIAATGALLSTNLLGVIAHMTGVGHEGESRLCAILYKYINFDVMTYGIAITAGAMLAIIVALQRPFERLRWHLAACATAAALAVLYPLMFPVLFIFLGAALAAPKLFTLIETRRLALDRTDLVAAGALAASFGAFWLNAQLLAEGEASSLVQFSDLAKVREWIVLAILAAGAWTPFLALALVRSWREKDAVRAAMLMTGAASLVSFLVLILPAQDQYKFMYVGLLVMIPLIADEALGLFGRLPRLGGVAAAATAAAFGGLVVVHVTRDHWPWFGVTDSPVLAEDRFIVEPIAPELAWTIAVRDQAPPDTVIVTPPSRMPFSVFAQRASYMPADVEFPYRFGHLIHTGDTLVEIKGLPREVIDSRTTLVESLYAPEVATDYTAAVSELRSLGRAVAVAGEPGNAFLAWLEANNLGQPLYEDDMTLVVLIPVADAATGAAGAD
jgi:hypothetical protein